MKKPNELVLWIYDNWPVRSVTSHVDENHNAVFTLEGSTHSRTVDYMPLVAVAQARLDHNSVLSLIPKYQEEARAYREWEKTNAKDLAEFKRLAEKLGIAV